MGVPSLKKMVDSHEGILVGIAAHREFAIGYCGGIDDLIGAAVDQTDGLTVVTTDTIDGILHLLCLCGQHSQHQGCNKHYLFHIFDNF